MGGKLFSFFILPLFLTLLLAATACDNSVQPLAPDVASLYSVSGYLDTAQDTQYVRVSALRESYLRAADSVNATLTLTALNTAERTVFRDSMVRLDNGARDLLYYAPLRVQQGEQYRLDVHDSGSQPARTSATTVIPPVPDLASSPVQGTGSALVQIVTLAGVQDPPRAISIRYRLREPDSERPVDLIRTLSGSGRRVEEGWQLIAPLSQDRMANLGELRRDLSDSTVVLLELGLQVELLSREWRTLERPDNIENGFGFFGAVGQYYLPWSLDSASVVRLGYAYSSE